MARSRNIKPGFFTNEDLVDIEPIGRLLYIGLWCLADRDGRLEDRPRKIKGELFPYENWDVNQLLNELDKHGFIIRYEIEGEKYIWIPKFKLHQNPHPKEKASVIPPVPDEIVKLHGKKFNYNTSREKVLTDRAGSSDILIPDSLQSDIIPAGKRAFRPPTLEEVQAYCQERNNGVDPERWFNFYQAKGWMVGKNKMKDWQAAIRTWEKNNKKPVNQNQIDPTQATLARYERM